MTTETSIYEYAKQGLLASPEKPALWFYDKSISYTRLFEMIDNAADHLYALGVRQGTVVTIHLPNCPQAVVAIYAVAKLGGICNMVHALMPLEGLRSNMAFTESSMLITGSHFADAHEVDFADTLLYADISYHMGFPAKQLMLLKIKVQVPASAIAFEELEQPCKEKAIIPPQESLAECCVSYLHSSGTTGTPKTVMHSHRNFNRWVACTRHHYFTAIDLTEQIFMCSLPWFHCFGLVADLHRALNGGGQLVLISKWEAKAAVRQIKKRKVNHILGVPSMFKKLLDEPSFSGKRIRQIQHCFVGGDRIDQNTKDKFDARIGNGRHICEGYGMSEIAVCSCIMPLSNYRSGASSYPMWGYLTAILNEEGTLVYEGEGELAVSTDCMMLGYLKDAAATAEVFFEADGRRWLRTGDYGRVDADGYIYCLGRLKNTIIHKGYNIYPHEVEAVLRKSLNVKDVCVVGIYSEEKQTQIVRAYVIAQADSNVWELEETLRELCKQHLLFFAQPEQYRFTDVLPTNAMGKIDRKALEQLL